MSIRAVWRAVVAVVLVATSVQVVSAAPAAAASVRDAIVAAAYGELNNSARNQAIGHCNWYAGHLLGPNGGCPNGWNATAWCSLFLRYVWEKTGAVAHTSEIGTFAQSLKKYGQKHGTWHPTGTGYAPRPGDAVVWKNLNGDGQGNADHTGIVVSYSNGVLKTIDGNWGQPSMVRLNTTNTANLQGYTSPVINDVIASKSSVGMYRGSDARFYLDYDYDGKSDKKLPYGQDGDMPVSGDWNGDGKHGLGLWRPSAGYFYLDENNDGTTDGWVKYGVSGDRPVAGNFDGVSGDGVGVYRAHEGRFHLDNNIDGTTDKWIPYGTSGDWPVAGNWDGVDADGIGVFRPSEGRFYLDDDNDGQTEHWVDYGRAGDLPLAGDWNADGTDGIGVFRPSDGMLYLDDDLDGETDVWIPYGASGDRPLSRTIG